MSKFSTVRITPSLSIAAATLLLAMPVASQAHDYDAAMDACIKAFVAAKVPQGHPVTVRKEESATSPVGLDAVGYKIIVSAKGVESGKYIARGTCVVDRSGEVIAVDGRKLPLQLASR